MFRSPLKEEAITEEMETLLYGVGRTTDILWDRLCGWNIKLIAITHFIKRNGRKGKKIK